MSALHPTKLIIRLAFAVFLVCLQPAFAEEEFYRWTDANGVINYGKNPPPGVEATLVTTYGGKGEPETGASPVEGDANQAPKQDAAPLTDEQKKARQERMAQCDQERKRLQTLKKPGVRIRLQGSDGNTHYASPDEITNEIATSEKYLSEACK